MTRKLIILTQGHTNPHTAKTACSVIRYRAEEVVAVLDSTAAGKTSGEMLQVGGDIPIVGSLADASQATTLLLGIAPPGGKIPPAWRELILEAIDREMDIVGGLHDFLSDDEQFAQAAEAKGVKLVDVRKNDEQNIAHRKGIRGDCLRVHTVGHDCSIGKMVTSIEICEALKQAGHDAKFVATGQTGIMVEGEGCPIDRVVADFVSGAAEKLVLNNQHHDILMIEGQGSLVHPAYSAVTLGLLHGCLPHALVLCYEVGRSQVAGMEPIAIPPLEHVKKLYEMMASVMQPCQVIGISMNSRHVSDQEAEAERQRMQEQFNLPVCDVFRHGADDLAKAVLEFKENGDWC